MSVSVSYVTMYLLASCRVTDVESSEVLPFATAIHRRRERVRSPANVCMKSFTCIVKTVSLGELSVLSKDTVLYSA